MQWLGFLTAATIYWCFFLAAVTGRWGWAALTGWLIPVLALTFRYTSGMAINGLMILICVVFFFLCRKGLVDVKMWNVKIRKKRSILFGILYIFTFLMLFYSLAQAQIQGYLLNLQGWGSRQIPFLRMGLSLIPLLLINILYTRMIYTAIDRIYCKKEKITLLACHSYISREEGMERGLHKGYFIEGIQNGITYHFRMTKRTYRMIKKEPHLHLTMNVGLLGGRYITDLEHPEWEKRTRKRDRREMWWGIILFVLVSIGTILLYWFY